MKIGCIFQKKKHVIFSSKYFELGCVFISNTINDREQGIPNVALVQGAILYWGVFSYQIQEMTMNRVFHNVALVQGAILYWGVFSYQIQEVTVNRVFHNVALVQGAILYWGVFSYQIQEMTMNRVFHNVVLVQGALCRGLNHVFRRKLLHDFIFGISY